MCGIAGYLSFESKFSPNDLSLLTDSLSHRGPDARGQYHDEVCGLGHRRLSVIDLSSSANQPMLSKNKRYVIVYNGEVYNFQEIADKIINDSNLRDYNFKTRSDTEIILEAFSMYGTEFVHLLNGMFAIAIWDTEKQELYLFRDRAGIKPLYYYFKNNVLVFASELKAIQRIKNLDLSINKKSISEFLHLGFIASPRTIHAHCYKVQPGYFIRFDRKGKEIHNYWNLRSKIHSNTISKEDEALSILNELLSSSVRYQLRADVPAGVFLSGGIDSSLLTTQAVHLSSSPISTFSVGFEENTHSELEFARAVSRHLKTNHHEYIVSYKDALELLSIGMETYDEPHADSSILPTMIVSRLARKHVTVALSGDGGDELFMGYGTYRWADRISNQLLDRFRKPIASILRNMPSNYQRYGKMIDSSNACNLRSHIFSQEQYYFTSEEIYDLVTPEYRSQDFYYELENFEETKGGSNYILRELNAMEKQSFFDIMYYLPEDLLTKVDRASMHYSLEARVPLLDHRIIEFALNLSPDLKYTGNTTKYLLKKILYQYVPAELFNRPKRGFSIPLAKWLKTELRYLIEDNLNKNSINQAGLVSHAPVSTLIRKFLTGHDYLFHRIWMLIIIHQWYRKNHLNNNVNSS